MICRYWYIRLHHVLYVSAFHLIMRLLVLGATSPTGILLVKEALEVIPTTSIILYVRSPSKIPSEISNNQSVTVIQGELNEKDKLSNSLVGVDAILSALGPPSAGNHPADLPLKRAYETLLSLMRKHGVKRLIALGTGSMVAPEDKFSLMFSLVVFYIKNFVPTAYKDIVAFGKVISAADDLDWTIVRVPYLTDKPNREVVAGFIGDPKVGTSLARAGYGAFCVQELLHPQWIRKMVAISSK